MIAAIVAVAGLSVAVATLARWARARRLLADSGEQLRQQNIRLDTALNNMTHAVGGAFLARLGGDEFVVIATGGEQPAAAAAMADRLLAAASEEIPIEGYSVRSA